MKWKLKNFRGHKKSSTSAVEAVNVLQGVNGYGKTSVLSAIKFAFTGIVPSDAIYAGEEEASVLWELEDEQGTVIERKLTKTERGVQQKVFINGKASTQATCDEFIKSKFGEKALEAASIAMYPEKIEQLDSKAILQTLLKIMPAKIKASEILSNTELSEDVLMELEMTLPEECTLDGIAELYSEYYDKRKFLKKEISELETLLKNTPEEPELPLREVEEKLAEIAKIESSATFAEKQLKEYNAAIQKNEKTNAEISALEKLLEKPAREIDDTAFTRKKVEISEIEELISSTGKTLSVLRNNATQTKKMLQALESNKCPLSEKLICNTDKTALKDELYKSLSQTIEEGTSLADREKLYKQKKSRLEEEYEALKKEKEAYILFKANMEKLEILKNSIVPVPAKPEIETNAISCNEKASLLGMKKAYESISLLESKKKLLANKKGELTITETLVEMLSEKGSIRKSALLIGLTPINKILSDYSDSFREGFHVRFEINSDVEIICRTATDKPEISITSLSTGEKAIFALFVTDCINKVCGFNELLIVDTLERLDAKNFNDVIGMIKVLDYKHAIVASCR